MARRPLVLAAAALAALLPAAPRAGGDDLQSVDAYSGRCLKARLRGVDRVHQCPGTLVHARFADGHQALRFEVEGETEVSFRVTRAFQRGAQTRVMLVDRLRVRQREQPVQGFCMATGALTGEGGLEAVGVLTLRCQAGEPGGADVADFAVQVDGTPRRQPVSAPAQRPAPGARRRVSGRR